MYITDELRSVGLTLTSGLMQTQSVHSECSLTDILTADSSSG